MAVSFIKKVCRISFSGDYQRKEYKLLDFVAEKDTGLEIITAKQSLFFFP